jgi:hypothetical protein
MVPGRNEKGQFLKGSSLFGKSKGIKNGRKKSIAGEVKDALSLAQDAMPDIIRQMIKRAKGGVECPVNVQQQAAEFLFEYIYGKAKQPIAGEFKIQWVEDGNEK